MYGYIRVCSSKFALGLTGSGLAGAVALNLIHETARQIIPHAPRVEVIGMRAIAKPMRRMGYVPPTGKRLYHAALIGDLISNSFYYSLIGFWSRQFIWSGGLTLGIVGGLGAVFLPKPVGLGRMPGQRTPWTQLMTVCWYTLGGIAASAAFEAIDDACCTND